MNADFPASRESVARRGEYLQFTDLYEFLNAW